MNFSSKNAGRWFWFNDKDSNHGGLCIRVLNMDESRRVEKITTTKKFKPVRGQPIEVRIVDEEMRDRLVWDYCIVAWKDVCLDGKLLECNAENKVMMMRTNSFASFFLDKVSELNDELEISQEFLEKNSETSLSGSVAQTAETV